MLRVRASVPVAELASAQGEALRTLWNHHLQHHGGRPADPLSVRYHIFGETETDMEVGIPVRAAVGDAYADLQAWLKEHGHQRAGPGWEEPCG